MAVLWIVVWTSLPRSTVASLGIRQSILYVSGLFDVLTNQAVLSVVLDHDIIYTRTNLSLVVGDLCSLGD